MLSLRLRFMGRQEIETNAGKPFGGVPSQILHSFAQALTNGGVRGDRARFAQSSSGMRDDHLVIFERAPELAVEPPGFVTAYVTGGEAR